MIEIRLKKVDTDLGRKLLPVDAISLADGNFVVIQSREVEIKDSFAERVSVDWVALPLIDETTMRDITIWDLAVKRGKSYDPDDPLTLKPDKMLYRKKPIEVEAMQYTKASRAEVIAFCDCQHINIGEDGGEYELENLRIHTVEGTMKLKLGDFVIKGINGEFYPCKPDIFDQTYDLVIQP